MRLLRCEPAPGIRRVLPPLSGEYGKLGVGTGALRVEVGIKEGGGVILEFWWVVWREVFKVVIDWGRMFRFVQ